MKRIFLTGYSLFILGLSAFATDKADEAKAAYQSAKTELMAMLNGQQAASYERAIFLMENAYWDNGLDYRKYREFIDWHTKNIGLLLSINRSRFEDNYSPSPLQAAMQSKESRAQALEKLATNWAIFTYMKGGSIPLGNNKNVRFVQDELFSYSYNDPMGKQDWDNTFVTHLLNTGKGNCFALASLYKIFSDRLNANAVLSTAPSHIFIRHANEKDLLYNIELSNGSFPGSGTIETLTYTTNDATNNNIAMRDIDDKQAIALCLVYLAKGYEQKFGVDNEAFLAECAEQALSFDEKSLNAMLLQFELLQRKVLAKSASPNTLKADKDFLALEQLTNKLCQLGYREMPLDMKNKLIQGWMRDTSMILVGHDYNPPVLNHAGVTNTPYASLSWGMFDEEIPNKPFEQYGSTVINTQTGKIEKFVKAYPLYNNYDFDPVVFAMNVDPLAHKLPASSPYAFCLNNPIVNFDPDGAFPYTFHVRAFAPSGAFKGFGFEDDGRGFSTSVAATSRIKQSFTIDPTARTYSGGKPTSDPTRLGSMSKIAKDRGGISKPEFSSNSMGSATAAVTSNFEGSNPLVPFAPNIKVQSAVSITENLKKNQLNVSIDLSSKAFPATEAFVQDASGKSVFLGGAAAFGSPTDLYEDKTQTVSRVDLIIGINDKGEFQNVTVDNKTYSIDEFNKISTSKSAGPAPRADKDNAGN